MTIMQSPSHSGEDLTGPGEAWTLDGVTRVVGEYYPGLVKPVLAELAVFGTMSLAGRTKPLSLIFESGSGSGKTAVVQMAFAINDGARAFVYRSDKFTPKSFVSHAANEARTKLENIDMLPRLKNKVLVTKELAPIFRGRVEELTENFAMLITVLDGKGLTSDSGMRGQRGYEESIVFNWIGATTRLPRSTHRLMSQLGTRLLFFEIPAVEPTPEELLEYAMRDDFSEAEAECNKAVNRFLLNFFEDHPIGSVEPKEIAVTKAVAQELVRWAALLVRGRAEVKYEKDDSWEPVAAVAPEAPYRVVGYLKELARGHALIHGRMEVDDSDLELVEEVAISSIPGHLRPLVRELRLADVVDINRAQSVCSVSRPTARNYLKELGLLGIAELSKGSPQSNQPAEIRLSREFSWLR